MLPLVRSLPALVLALAAVESLLVRFELEHRPTDWRLFLQAALLWLVLGALACLPAWGSLRLWRRWRKTEDVEPSGSARILPAVVLAGWMAGPVLVHATLDRYTGLDGNTAALASIRPWLEAAGVVAVLLLVLFGLWKAGGRLASRAAVLALCLLSVGVGLFLPWRPASVGAAPGGQRPNLLLLVWDTLRADRTQPYGYERETTPHLARLAAESVVFEDVRSVSCFTFTSHLSMLTGVHPSTHGARLLSMRYDPRRATSIADTLRREGYRTGAFVGTDVLAGRTGIRHGFEVYDDQVDPLVCDTRAWQLVHDVQVVLARMFPVLRYNGRPHWIQDFQRPADEVLEGALAWIRDEDPRPWFCMVNLYDVHWPYVPGEDGRTRLVRPYAGPLDGYLFRSDAWEEGYAIQEEDAQHVSDLYDAEILDLDAAVDVFLGELDLGGGNTAVVMTSDHGEAFGEAGRWKHEDITEPQVQVPLIVRRAEPSPTGSRVSAPASGVDTAPTLLGLAGLPLPAGCEGYDLLSGEVPADREILVEDRDRRDPRDVRIAWYRGSWKLVRKGLGEDVVFELFDLETDPVGEVDVSAEHPDVLEALSRELTEWREAADARDARDAEEVRGQADALRALGYGG